MAYFNQETEDENQNAQGMNNTPAQGQAPSQSGPIQTTQASSTMGSGPAPAAPKSTKPSSSGSGPGFQSYAKANQGKAQDSLNSAAAQAVTNSGQAATNAINQAQTAFGKKVDQGSLANRENAVQDVQNTVQSARQLQAGTNVDQGLQDRFKEIINTRYKGPESLRQAGLYNPASQAAQTAQGLIDNSKTATGREEMLKQMYQKRGDYTSGLNKLDSALLNSSQTGVQNLQNAAQAQGDVGQKLDQAQVGSANLAQNRNQEIQGIRQQARDTFSAGKTAEEKATDERLASVVENWEQLPEYYRNLIRNSSPNSPVQLTPEEAAVLGVSSGEGLYRLGEGAIKSGVADKKKLISKDEQARQAALSSLAGLDLSNQLDTNLLYDNADLAGTQTSLDALDTQKTREALNQAEQGFREFAQGSNIVGTGSKKNKTSGKRYYASQEANLGNLLTDAGYDFDNPLSKQVGNRDVARALSGANYSDLSPTTSADALFEPWANASANIMGNTFAPDVLSSSLGFMNEINPVSKLATDLLGKNASLALGLITNNPIASIAGSLLGGGTSSKESKADAALFAAQDLENKVNQSIDESGFKNRINVGTQGLDQNRLSALQSLLSNLDKTNS